MNLSSPPKSLPPKPVSLPPPPQSIAAKIAAKSFQDRQQQQQSSPTSKKPTTTSNSSNSSNNTTNNTNTPVATTAIKPSPQTHMKLPLPPRSVTGKPMIRLKGSRVIFRRSVPSSEQSQQEQSSASASASASASQQQMKYLLQEGIVKEFDESTRTIVIESNNNLFSGISIEEPESATVWSGPSDILSTDDVVAIRQPDTLSVLYCLQQRFFGKIPYTWLTRDSLVYVNPFQKCPDNFIGGLPHPYSVAEQARLIIRDDACDVAVVVTGQSGAGKTEAAKMILKQFAAGIAASSTPLASPGGRQHQLDFVSLVAAVNPILESFGNAVTAANQNSSRFIRTTRIVSDRKCRPRSAEIQVSLLETSRLCGLRPGESSFHIFYAMLGGLSSKEKLELELTDATLFRSLVAALNDSNSAKQIEMSPSQWLVAAPPHKLHDIVSAMSAVQMTESDIKLTFRMLAFVLHLLNVEFSSGDASSSSSKKSFQSNRGIFGPSSSSHSQGDHAKIISTSSQKSLATAAKLLGIDSQKLEEAMTTLKFTDPASGAPVIRKLPVSSAIASRDTIARNLYSSVFLWIVGKINDTLQLRCEEFMEQCGSPDRDRTLNNESNNSSPNPSQPSFSDNKNSNDNTNDTSDINQSSPTKQQGEESNDKLQSLLILDVFGFESMRNVPHSTDGVAPPSIAEMNCHNGLEQLLINFVNEELQHLFTQTSLIGFCDELVREGISLNSSTSTSSSTTTSSPNSQQQPTMSPAESMARDLADNQLKTMTCLSKKTGGILATINDDSMLPHAALPSVLQDRIMTLAPKNPTVIKKLKGVPDPDHPSFVVEHFACPVPYSTTGMSSKNKISSAGITTLMSLVSSSSSPVTGSSSNNQQVQSAIANLLRSAESSSKKSGEIGGGSSSTTFTKLLRDQFDQVLTSLKKSRCLWVRCIKPNNTSTPNTFDAKDVRRQLLSNGILASANVLAQGLSVRIPIKDFALRFAVALDKYPWRDLEKVQFRKICEAVSKKLSSIPSSSSSSATSSPGGSLSPTRSSMSSSPLHQQHATPTNPMQIGLTKCFLNSDTYEDLTILARARHSAYLIVVQKGCKGFQGRLQVGEILRTAVRRRIAHELALRIESERPQREELEIERCADEERSAMMLTSLQPCVANFQQDAKSAFGGSVKSFLTTMNDEFNRVCVDVSLYERIRGQKERELKEKQKYIEEIERHREEKAVREVRGGAMGEFRKLPVNKRMSEQLRVEEKKRQERLEREAKMRESITWAHQENNRGRLGAEIQLQKESAKSHATRQVHWLHQHLHRSWDRLDKQSQVVKNREMHVDATVGYQNESQQRAASRSLSSRRSESIISPAYDSPY